MREKVGSGHDALRDSLKNKLKKERRPLIGDSMVQQMRAKFAVAESGKNHSFPGQPSQLFHNNRPTAQESEECREDERSIEAHINEMSTEMLKVHPDLNSLKERMRRTYAYRKTFMATAKAEEIIEKFPALKLPKILLWETKEQFLVEADRRMVTKLDRMATKMVQRASMCDLKDCYQRAINACLNDSDSLGMQQFYCCLPFSERSHPFYTLYWSTQRN
ncbi:uncharacterized protein LOC133665241 [Entelurus aequoreus]|uniref:uncharacterized protein LOC133665241 n=1 Tax=Entelurus aequoreus TaxID=161455 RepID=UPI002B1D51C0|nr:uncharacterized protein LOC133665241 [Entelurus aequoreus]